MHPYVNRVDEGRAARAAQRLGAQDPTVYVAADAPATLGGPVEPEVATALQPLLNDRGRQLLAETTTQCVASPFAAAVAAQKIGTLRPAAPVYVWQGRNDNIVPYPQSRQLATDWCGQGASVTCQRYDIPRRSPASGSATCCPRWWGCPRRRRGCTSATSASPPPTAAPRSRRRPDQVPPPHPARDAVRGGRRRSG